MIFAGASLDKLHEDFTLKELHGVLLASGLTDTSDVTATWAARGILLLAESNFEVNFARGTQVSQRVLFPCAPSQSNGIEDARFIRFRKDDGSPHLLCDLHRLRWQGDVAAIAGDAGFFCNSNSAP